MKAFSLAIRTTSRSSIEHLHIRIGIGRHLFNVWEARSARRCTQGLQRLRCEVADVRWENLIQQTWHQKTRTFRSPVGARLPHWTLEELHAIG
jgi:lipopolysaccharide/colanic/teichoic acid biosynthesis glycosyltransferase